MFAPLLILTIGGIMVYSALKGVGLTDVFAGMTGDTLNPHGSPGGVMSAPALTDAPPTSGTTSGNTTDCVGPSGAQLWTAPPGGAHCFKGAHAASLNALAYVAQHQFGLRITATNNGGHVPGSLHYANQAFDAAGPEVDMRAFAQYVEDHAGGLSELIHNPGFAIKDGKRVNGPVAYVAVWEGHRDHVHVGWS